MNANESTIRFTGELQYRYYVRVFCFHVYSQRQKHEAGSATHSGAQMVCVGVPVCHVYPPVCLVCLVCFVGSLLPDESSSQP